MVYLLKCTPHNFIKESLTRQVSQLLCARLSWRARGLICVEWACSLNSVDRWGMRDFLYCMFTDSEALVKYLNRPWFGHQLLRDFSYTHKIGSCFHF